MNKNLNKIKVACLQLNSQSNTDKNLKKIEKLISLAVQKGANLIATPENSNVMHPNKDELLKICPTEKTSSFLIRIKEIASANSVWILIGSLIIKHSKNKLINRSYLINDSGNIVSKYDKIHMFDVMLSKNESYNESALYKKGNKLSVARTPWADVGMTICYDLRFPNIFRKLALAGSKIIFVPAAFTKTTGKAHWITLIRARAIETGCFIVAPAQYGLHYKGRETFGNSIIVSPWGKIIKQKKSGVGLILAELNLKEVKKYRESIPSLYLNNKY